MFSLLKKGNDFGFRLFKKVGWVGGKGGWVGGKGGLGGKGGKGGLGGKGVDERRFENAKSIVEVVFVVRVTSIIFWKRRRWR